MNSKKSAQLSDYNDGFEVFFDGQCPLCRREIDMIRRKDKQGLLTLTDIAAADFRPTDRSLDQLMKEIHGRLPNGQYVTGVEVFRQIYQRLGWGWVFAPTRWPILRQLFDLGYRGFAALRYRHAMHRMKKAGVDCQACQVTPSSKVNRTEPSP